MNLQENIRKVLREIDEDRVQIRLGRSADRHFGKVQNIIIQVDDNDITSQDDEPGLGKMNIVIKDNEIIVGDIFIPEKYRRQGIATAVYQKISDHFGLPIVSSKTKGFNQTMEGGYIWKDREKFEPRDIQESIKKVLREETKLPSFIRRRYSEEDIDELISNVKFSIPKYDDDKNIDDVIYDEVREFMMDKSDFGYHGTLRNDLTGNEYYRQLSKFEEPLRDYVKSVILNTNLQENIRRILREDISNRAQEKLNQILKSQGVVSASKAVGGFQKLSKVLNFDLNDMDTQEMLVKNFIYFDNTEEVNVNYLDIRTSANGGKVININGTTTGTAGNMDSWYINHICDKLNEFFPFRAQPAYHPVFAARGIRIFIDAELIFQEV